MSTPLLTTKFYFPKAVSRLVPRQRLLKRLEEGLSRPLTLISAPAGYGKTTLMSEWRAGSGKNVPAAWLSIDDDDNDLTRFLQYLCAALEILFPGLEEELHPLLETSEMPNAEAVLTYLINRLNELKQESILALDDYQLIELPALHRAMTFLLEHLPQHLHLVLLTRANPPLPLARMRARGQLTEIRLDDLRFNTEDTARFLNQVMGLNLTGDQVSALERRTEGWIAGLQLVALSLQDCEDVQGFISEFAGSDHYIVDYLAEEVLSRQPEKLQEFLFKTSILERLTGSLCNFLTGQTDGQVVLESLEHANLFIISLDNQQCWYRYHRLFADLLNSRLLHYYPDTIFQLHVNASEWFEANGFLDEAINHALAAKDYWRAARLYCREQLEIIYSRPLSTLDRWLASFPDNFLCTEPWLCIAKAYVLWATGRRGELESYVICAEHALAEMVAVGSFSESSPEYKALLGYIFTFKAMAAYTRNEFAQAVALSQQAIAVIPQDARNHAFALAGLYMAYELSGDIARSAETCSQAIITARHQNYFSLHATASYTLARLLRVQGHLHNGELMTRQALEFVDRQDQSRLFHNGILHIALAEIYYERNALDDMQSELEAGLTLCRQGGMSTLLTIGLFNLSLLRHARGDWLGALEVLQEIERGCQEMDPTTYQETCTTHRLWWQAEQGNLAGLEEAVSHFNLDLGQNLSIERFHQLYHASQFLYYLGRHEEALQVLHNIESLASSSGLSGWLINIFAMQAIIWQKAGSDSRALDCLGRALELAEPEGYVRVFLDLGDPMRKLLLETRRHSVKPDFTNRILAAYEEQYLTTVHPIKTPEILSKRELELLRLIAAGRSNKQIADELFISIGTVKRHTANIFDKLDVSNRTEAVARAREINLLA